MISIIASKSRATPKHPPRVISARLVCVFQFLVRSFTLSEDDRLAMPVAFSLSSFLLRSVCAPMCITVVSDAVHCPARLQNGSKIIGKIDRKSIAGEAPGHPKSITDLSLDPLGTNRCAQGRPEGISEASRELLGASPARLGTAWRVPKRAL